MTQRIPIDQDYFNAIIGVRDIYDGKGFDAALNFISNNPVKNWRDYHFNFREKCVKTIIEKHPDFKSEGYMPDWEKVTPENQKCVAVIDSVVKTLNFTKSEPEFRFCINTIYDILYGYFYYK